MSAPFCTCGQTLDNHGDCWDCQEAAQPVPRLDDVRARYWEALSAELEADPCTPERALLAQRSQRLSRLAQAVYLREYA